MGKAVRDSLEPVRGSVEFIGNGRIELEPGDGIGIGRIELGGRGNAAQPERPAALCRPRHDGRLI
jgi:hypothetical protein